MQFHEKADAPSVIARSSTSGGGAAGYSWCSTTLVAHRSKAMADYVRNTDGEVVLWFLPPRTSLLDTNQQGSSRNCGSCVGRPVRYSDL